MTSAPAELVVVCCHAIFHGRDPCCEDDWVLQPFQKSSAHKPAEHLVFLEHIRSALSCCDVAANRRPQLVFSGGRTKHAFPDLSEARSYLHAARRLNWLPEQSDVLLDELATDSFQNVLFSIVAFRKRHGCYPAKVTVVTHDFKTKRFVELHCPALRWPRDRFVLLGVPLSPQVPQAELDAITAAESKNGYGLWVEDPYGSGNALSAKRTERRWDASELAAVANDLEPNVQKLLFWNGGPDGKEHFPLPLPWTDEQA